MTRTIMWTVLVLVAGCGPVPSASDFSAAPPTDDPRERAYRECLYLSHHQSVEPRLREALKTCMEAKGYTLRP